ncbi:MAG: YqeG family HAD IIIA-type phosphatase [Oscillospiraceae bacterium]|nr:YqeG family HAD IIIA-type phosphatase [Oscillospiraceae bacterium]
MSILPIPDIMADSIYDVDPTALTARGVRLVLLDVDNTLAPYTENSPRAELPAKLAAMQAAGLELFIFSNSRTERPRIFSKALGLDFEQRAGKPRLKKLRAVLAEKGVQPRETALIGDQIYTDVLCAKRAGAVAVLVKPILFSNPFLALRYQLERPFRFIGARRQKRHEQH